MQESYLDTTDGVDHNTPIFPVKPQESETKTISDYIIKKPLKATYNLAYGRAILIGLQGKPVYSGTVTEKVKEKRRARNRVARASRKRNRT